MTAAQIVFKGKGRTIIKPRRSIPAVPRRILSNLPIFCLNDIIISSSVSLRHPRLLMVAYYKIFR
jgi:hypothetical protein